MIVVTVAIVTGGFLTVCLVFERFTIGRPTVEHTMQIFFTCNRISSSFGKMAVMFEGERLALPRLTYPKSVKHYIDNNRLFIHF